MNDDTKNATKQNWRGNAKNIAIFVTFFVLGLGSLILYLFDNGSSQANLVGAAIYVSILNVVGYLMDSVSARWGASLALFVPVTVHVGLLII